VLSWLKDWTFFPYPNTLGASIDANQSFAHEESRIQPDVRIPNIMNFETSRQLQFSWKIFENGLLNPTLDYSVNTIGTLVPFWVQPGTRDIPLPAEDIRRNISSLFGGTQLLNLGVDSKHGQNFRLTFRPKLPDFMGGSKFFTLTGNFGTQYGWERLLRPLPAGSEDLNKAVGYQNTINATFGIRAKELGNTLFPTLGAPQGGMTLMPGQPNILGTSATQNINASIANAILRTVKSVIFDWEQFNITFTQQNVANNSGVRGGTGFLNAGPSTEYQLGLVEEPHNSLFRFVPSFPFLQIQEQHGARPVGVDLPDILKHTTTVDMRTQREIIPGLQIELSWLSKFEDNRNRITRQLSDSPNDTLYLNAVTLQTYGRSFLAPPIPFLNPLQTVKTLYDSATAKFPKDSSATQRRQDALNDAFVQGLEANPFHWFRNGIDTNIYRNLLRILPNLNFALRWNGLDQLPFFKGILRSGSLEMKYQGRYSATQRKEAGVETLDQQAVTSSFEPLLGITAQFDDKFAEGIMSGNFRWGTKSSYGIAQSQQGIVQSEVSTDLTMQFTYTRRGFELPKIGGLSLLKIIGIDFEFTNDIEFGFQGTYRTMLRSSINVLGPTGDIATGAIRRIDGTTNISIEPSMRYTISKQVTARLFFKYEANLTEGAVAPGSSTTTVGVDLRLNLSGGRSF
jgi:cell surface protein SprA